MALSDNEFIMSSSELLQAHSLLWRCSIDYMKSMSLKCAIELGIPDAIHKHGQGQPIPFSKLVASLPIQPSKAHSLYRVMRILVHFGIFKAQKVECHDHGTRQEEEELAYSLTSVSQLLITEKPSASMKMQSVGLLNLLPQTMSAWHSWSTWFQSTEDNKTLFEVAHGKTFWDCVSQEPNINFVFNDAMANNSLLMAKVAVEECKEVFENLKSVVDLGGGTGTMAKAITNAFPHVSCTVIDLPHSVLHDWDDEDCVRILKRSREAIMGGGNKEGKVILIEMSLGYAPMAAAGDRPIDEDRGLLTDEDREFYRVQREARFDIPSRVSVGSAMGMVRPRPRPRRQLEVGDVPPEPLFDEPSAEDVVDFRVGVPNRVQRRTIGENQQSIAGDVLLWVKSSNQHTSATVDGGRSFPPTPLFSSPSDGGRGTRRWNAHQQPRSPPSLHREPVDHLEIIKIEELDDQIGLRVAIEAHSGPTNKVVEEVIIIEAQLEKPTIESIIFQDLAVKPRVHVGQCWD
ncbi:hypothetical protein TIFTF001_030272 [Ficus carica]|uniref:Uncharacterized protein n=1 Tax=Ficus carica TaxID=3494 RepID=A0AA88DSW2_FICCA|nr:hypothetical protein TIFTF001_030272 [Ficus carica]